jgi:hypothetical protein
MNIWRMAARPRLIAAGLIAAGLTTGLLAAAQDGGTVSIAPGVYYDCAQWHANRLTIAATGPGVQLTDTACAAALARRFELMP